MKHLKSFNEGLIEDRVGWYIKIAKIKYNDKTADEIIDIIENGNDNMKFNSDEEKRLFKTEWDNKTLNELTDNKLNGELYLIQEDGGDQLYFTGIYDDLKKFINDIKNKISQEKEIDITEIEIKTEGIESYPGSKRSDAISVIYGYSKDIFYYEKININELR